MNRQRVTAAELESLRDEVERVLVAGWLDDYREPWKIAEDIVSAMLDKCLTICQNDSDGATSSQLERGNYGTAR